MKRRILATTALLMLVGSVSSCSSNGSSDTTSSVVDATMPSNDSSSKIAGPVEINVIVGVDSSPQRTEEIRLGSDVNIRLLNPDADDSFHLHGYDLSSGDTPKGETAMISFTADIAGDFEIESHVTEEVLVNLSVK